MEANLRVRYNPAVGIVLLALGAVCEFLGLWLFMLGESSPALFAGLVPMVLGVLYLVRPYFWVYATSVALPAPIGPVKRQFPFQSLEVDGRKLIATRDDGTRKKVPVARWLAHPTDWREVTAVARPGG